MRAPNRPSAPFRRLALPLGLVLLGAVLLLCADDVEAGPGSFRSPRLTAPADTDSVAIDLPRTLSLDSLDTDTTETDTTDTDSAAVDSTRRARTYFPRPVRTGSDAAIVPRRLPGIRGRLGTYWRREVTLDTTAYRYRVREVVGEDDVRAPADVTLDEFLAARRQEALGAGFRELVARRTERQQRRNGFGFAVDIPGGDQSAFSTIFGKNEVALTVNGTSNVNLGMRYNQNDLSSAISGRDGSFAPDFGQELNLNVAGTIGDKLAINVNYDTQSQFDFENQVSLVYTGYEDDIIQRIEAGNVFLQTPATLIRGGQRLFGLRTDLQFGPLALTAVASQQDAQTVAKVFEGGTDSQTFRLAPYDYEDNTHFFLGYAFHNWYDEAHVRPGTLTPPPGFVEFIGIEVWKHEPSLNQAPADANTTWAVALADLGEPTPGSPGYTGYSVLDGGEAYLGDYDPATFRYENAEAPLPDPERDQYSNDALQTVRQNPGGNAASRETLVGSDNTDQKLPARAFSNNKFRKLRANVDYTFDPTLGYLSLTSSLTENDQLAVAYQYRVQGPQGSRVVTVGDYNNPVQSDAQTGGRTILKLLRSDRPIASDPLWDLTLRNIYRVGGRSLDPNNFAFDIRFEPSGATPSTEPRDVSFEQRTFMQILGLDRVNLQGTAVPDNAFDFQSQITVDRENGRILFPVRQPFGDYVRELLASGSTVSNQAVEVSLGALSLAQAQEQYSPTTAEGEGLYELPKDRARSRLGEFSKWRLEGEFSSQSQSTFNLGFNLVEGTVRVSSDGRELTEGADFRVNYTAGTVEIINPLYLQEGKQVRVEVEQQKFFSVGSKTLLGLRADYRLDEDFNLGATWMQLAERPLGDKFRVGEEPLNNSILGFDGSYLAEPRWLTRALDALPLVQTRAPSRIEIRGEFARLTPGHPQTFAFDRARQALRDASIPGGLDFAEDELNGVSYIDDFEGSENAYTALETTGGWRIAAAPDSAGPPGSEIGGAYGLDGTPEAPNITDTRLKGNWRGLFTWYSISETSYREYSNAGLLTRATEPITPRELFPEREFLDSREANTPLGLLDLYFDPTRRGPYNFNGSLSTEYAQDPRDAWGGFIRPIDASYSDFEGQNNIEFIEMLFAPLGGKDGTQPVNDGAVLYVDLGQLNEDVLPNNFPNSEDGIANRPRDESSLDGWGRRPSGQTNGVVDFFEDTGRTEDLGLDGLPSRTTLVASNGENYPLSEVEHFGAFLNTLPVGSAEQLRAALDPAGDDYIYYRDESYNDTARYPGGATVQERYGQYLPASELNSAIAGQEISGSERGVSTIPNDEDINGNGRTDVTESYHRYTIPLDETGLKASPFFQNTLDVPSESGQPQTWYLLRIPVRTSLKTSKGLADDDFSRIETVRMWTTGHEQPATLRFASLELVGSQWLKSDVVGFDDEGGDDDPAASGGTADAPSLFIESINNEENDAIYALPRGTVQNTARSIGGQIRATREQALVFRAEGLAEGRRAGIIRSYATRPLDLTKYSNVRMAVHGHGFERSDSVRVFVRLGDNETEDYYEFEQPVYPFHPKDLATLPDCPIDQPSNCTRSDSLWQTNVGPTFEDLNPINIVLSELNRAKLARDQAEVAPSERFTLDGTPEAAPAGARISVRGQPSIQDVRTIVLGVRNGPSGDPVPIDTVSVWFNELRVTGYDEGGGASGFLTANVALADLATVNARMSFQQDGFGELGGALGGRSFASLSAFTLTSSLAAHKLLPERFGWNIPISVSLTENTSTPRYDPDNGDVRLQDLIDDAEAGALDAGEGGAVADALTADAILERAQTISSSRNVRVAVSKSNSRSPWLKYTIDGLAASYTLSNQDGSSPSNSLTASDSWTTNLSYRVSVPRPLTIRPFWFTGGVPVLGSVVGGLRLNVLPQRLTLSADAARRVSATRQRLAPEYLSEPAEVREFRSLTRRTQQFDHGRQIDVAYNPLSFLNLTYASNVSQDLGAAGQDESFQVLVRGTDGSFSKTYALSAAEARSNDEVLADLAAAGLINPGDPFPSQRVEILGGSGSQLEVLPIGEALGNVFSGGVRTKSYSQSLTSALTVSTRRLKWLSWIRPQRVSYSANYNWTDQPIPTSPELEVASTGTRSQIRTGLAIAPREFWRLFPFYRKMEEAAGRSGSGRSGARQAAATDSTGGGFNPLRLVRGAFLAATGIDDITLTYNGSLTASTGGLRGQSYSLFAGLWGDAPPLGYRLGFDRILDIDRRIADPTANLTFSDLLGEQHDLDARTTLQPFRGLNIGLNLKTGWQESENVTFGLNDRNELIKSTPNRRGSGTSTVFSFGGSYLGLLQRHADRYREDVAGAGAGSTIDSEFGSPTGLAEDFASELARGAGGFGPSGLFALPLPNWNVTYSGLEKLPLVRIVAQQVTLQHGYSSTSQTEYATFLGGSAREVQDPLGGGFVFRSAAADGAQSFDEATALTVSERFQPLIGVNLGLKGGIQTSLTLNRSHIYSLQTASAQFSEKNVGDVRVDFSYAKTGLRLLGLRRLNNNIRFTLTALVANDETTRRTLQQDVLRLLQGTELDEPTSQSTQRIQISPQISYTISNQVTADLFVRYERSIPKGTTAFPNTNVDGGVNLRILFSN